MSTHVLRKLLLLPFFLCILASASAQTGFLNAGPDVVTCDGAPVTLTSVGNTPQGLQLQNISGAGAANNLTDDSYSNAVNIGFSFNFYGNNYNQCLVSSNMYITFNTAAAGGYSAWPINNASPNPNNPLNAIMSPWQDVNPNTSASHVVRVGRYGTAPNRVFVVEWVNLVTFSCGGDCNSTQIILYEGSNIIETHIAEKSLCGGWNGGAAIHGLQNSTGNIAHIVPGRNFPANWTCVADGKRFTPSGPNNYTITTIPFLPVALGQTPNATYSWAVLGGGQIANGTTVTVSPSTTTSYVATLSNTSCQASFTYRDTVTVFVSNPVLTLGSQNVDCTAGTAGKAWASSAGATLPVVYSWNTAPAPTVGDTIFGLEVGTYTCTLTDAIGCNVQGTVTVAQQGVIPTQIDTIQNLRCFGDFSGALTVSATSAASPFYYILNGDTSMNGHFANLSAGQFGVQVIDQLGCVSLQPVTLSEPQSPLVLSIDQHNNNQCFGQTNGFFRISATGGTSPYLFNCGIYSNTTGDFSNLPADTYTLSVSDSNGCYAFIIDSIIEPQLLEVSIPTWLDISCHGLIDGSANAVATGGTLPYNFSWSSIPAQLTPNATGLPEGIYDVLVQDANGCQAFSSVSIIEPQPLVVTAVADAVICEADSVLISSYAAGGTGDINYSWTPGNIALASSYQFPVVDTEYIVTVSDQRGCIHRDTMFVTVHSNPQPVFTASVNSGCVPLCVRFDDLTPAPINSELVARSWDFGNAITDTVQSREFCYYLAGRNDVTLSLLTDKGCKRVLKREGLIEAFGLPDPDFRFGAASSDILKPSVEIENLTVNATSFTWNFGDGSPLLQTFSPVHEFPDTGTYFVKLYAENDQGCIDSIIKMYVVDPFYTFYIPNSFTPNGDGKNDFFTIKGQFIDTYDIQIFDRWGRVIFSQVNTEGVRWDANQVPDGVYIYSIKVSDVGGKEHKYKGTLSVIR
jgi:gliding motility-associated-like protein